jgi:hypothetical protein
MPSKRDNDEERRERVEHQVREVRKRPLEPIEVVPREQDCTFDGRNDHAARKSRTVDRDPSQA